MPDFIARGNAEFNAWQANFVNYANLNLPNLDLVILDSTSIFSAQPAWKSNLTGHIAAGQRPIGAGDDGRKSNDAGSIDPRPRAPLTAQSLRQRRRGARRWASPCRTPARRPQPPRTRGPFVRSIPARHLMDRPFLRVT